MSYNSIREMAVSPSLLTRIAAAAAEQGIDAPVAWANAQMWALAASPGWAAKWDSAEVSLTINQNPDLGARTDVVSDADILSAVQVLKAKIPKP